MSSWNDEKENANEQIIPDPDRITAFMRQSLEQLQSSLICPLCHQMLKQPCTLACAHTFCWGCIETYSCNNSLCPAKGCGIPMSATGSRKGSFLKVNPSIESVVDSFQTICQTLDRAPKQWWNHGKEEEEEENDKEVNSGENNQPTAAAGDDDDDDLSSDEEMITLDLNVQPQDSDDDDLRYENTSPQEE